MKKIIAMILALVMCLSMVACSNTEQKNENTEPDTTIEQVENETTEPDNSTETTETTESTESDEEDAGSVDNVDEDETTNNKEDDKANKSEAAESDKGTNKESGPEHNGNENGTNSKTEANTNESTKVDNEEDTEVEETEPADDVAGAGEDKNETVNTEATEAENNDNEESNQETTTPAYAPNQLEQNIFNIINQHRANAGLPALTFEYSFYSAASTRASEAANHFSHTRPNGNNYTSVFADHGIKWDFIAGENVGRYFADAETAMNAFMASQVHKDNILYAGYTRVCIAVVESELYPGYYVIEQLFAGPAGAY